MREALCAFAQRASDLFVKQHCAVITAKIKIEQHKLYGGDGPVLYATDVALSSEPKQPVATFY